MFNRTDGDGYIVVSADDNFTPLLGYSDKGNFDNDNMPAGLKYMLDMYAGEMRSFNKSDKAQTVKTPARRTFNAVGPLLTSAWHQDDPYNRQCPLYNDFTIGVQPVRSPTGCVATAMAQIMYYHRYPVKGSDKFADVTFDWDNMLDAYYDGYTDVQADAVATLMAACGSSVDMRYGKYESGASTPLVLKALGDYFSYDKSSFRIIERDHTPLTTVIDLLHNELTENRPVLVGADSRNGGHAFVLDGCDSDGYFHINWGWGGMSDGYFLLSALNPSAQGTGGSDGAYNYNQEFYTGIQKQLPVAGDYSEDLPEIVAGGDIFYCNDEVWETRNDITYKGFLNVSPINTRFYFGTKAVNIDDGTEYFRWHYDSTTLGPSYYTSAIRASANPAYESNPTDGNYEIYLVYRTTPEGKIKTVSAPMGMQQGVTATCTNGRFVINYGQIRESNLEITSVGIPAEIPMGNIETVSCKLTNNDKEIYHGDITLKLTDASGNSTALGRVMTDIDPGEAFDFSAEFGFEFSQGEYKVTFTDIRGKLIGESASFTITAPDLSRLIAIDETNFPDAAFRDELKYYDTNRDGYFSESERNELTYLYIYDGTPIYSLKGLEYFPELVYLCCRNCYLTEVDLTALAKLEEISLYGNQIHTLALGDKPVLKDLGCGENQLAELDLSACPALETLYCHKNLITELNISACRNLNLLCAYENQIAKLVSNDNAKLENVDLDDNKLEEIDLSGWHGLRSLNLYGNQLETIDLSQNTELEELTAAGNKLCCIDLSANTKLTYLFAYNVREVYTEEYMDQWQNRHCIFDFKDLEKYGFDCTRLDTESVAYPFVDLFKVDLGWSDDFSYYYRHGANVNGDIQCLFRLINIGEDPGSGICDAVADDCRVEISGRAVRISGQFKRVAAYNMTGACVYNGSENRFELPAGVYAVVVDGRTYKIAVK